MSNETLAIPLNEIQIDDTLHSIEEPVEIMDHEVKRLKRSRIPIVKNKSLSLAGRVQLIRSVLASMHIYWSSVFILPSSLMLELEQLMRGFLWCQGEMEKDKAKVTWEVVCLPKKEGGLGIRRLEVFNKALIASHIWSLLLNKESLWIKWIHTYKLNGHTLWETLLRGKMSWGWRKILQDRHIVRPFIWFRLSAKVMDVIDSGAWRWPIEWNSKYPNLDNIAVLNLSGVSDRLVWKNSDNVESGFSVATVWNCIRPRVNEVDWFHVVWFSHQIPRHAIHLWLVIHRKLKTQDKLSQWDEHLKRFTGISNIPSNLSSIVDFFHLAGQYEDQIIDVIKSTVHLKLLTCKFKKTKNVQMLIHLWKLPTSLTGSSR
ncbi:hypothetical protein Tco_0383524 [Tanacetum coccineum]